MTAFDRIIQKATIRWHPKRNGRLTPNDVTPGSMKKIWMLCDKGHEWDAFVFNLSRGQGCPYCAGKRVGEDNSLARLNPQLACEWHPSKNGHITPEMVTAGSGKKSWWKCRHGHEWEALIASRNSGVGCPYCKGRKASKQNCLKTLRPDLAREWHLKKNKEVSPENVTMGSHVKVWWRCNKGHDWKATVHARSCGTGCPYCAGKKVDKSNSLRTLRPELAGEWHRTKNGRLTPDDVIPGSTRKVWWQCRQGHAWEAVISSRSAGRGCPYCASRKVCKDNCLQTVRPELAREWHPTKNVQLTPQDVTPGSGKKVWWRCRNGHEWKAAVLGRTRKTGCPYCAGQKPTLEHSLRVKNPGLAGQWHPMKNLRLSPKDVFPHSRHEVWWKCHKGHEWQKRIVDRMRGCGCPICAVEKE